MCKSPTVATSNVRFIACASLMAAICACGTYPAWAQAPSEAPGNGKAEKLFTSDQTLQITLRAPWNDIVKKPKNQDPYPATLEFSDSQGALHSLPLTVQRRGLSRQTVCAFPPIKLRFAKDVADGTIFRGQESLKIVTHCGRGGRWEQYYIKEMLAYRMYNLITDRSFRVRPLSATYVDSKKNSNYVAHFAFVVEDVHDVAKRNGMQTINIKRIRPDQMESTDANRFALFQYMIANVDWAALKGPGTEDCCHNGKVIGLDADSKLYIVPYDFDSSGLVDTHYAAPHTGLPIAKVTQRLYRGFCAHNSTLEATRQEFLAKGQAIIGLIENESRLNTHNAKVAVRYLDGFFDVLRDDYKFDQSIIQRCRK